MIRMLREGWCYLFTTAGPTAMETNHCLSGSELNQWQCTKLFIDYLYLNFTAKTYPSASTKHQPTIGAHTGAGIRGNGHQGPGHGGMAGVKGRVVHYRGGEENMWCTTEGGKKCPYSLTPHCRIVQYRHLQLQYILHFR